MNESDGRSSASPRAALDVAALQALVDRFAEFDTNISDVGRVDALSALARVKAAAAALEARLTDAFVRSQRAAQIAAGAPARRVGAGIATQLGLARRISPSRAAVEARFAHDLVHELPRTHAALSRGELSEWRAMLIARETSHLSTADRAAADTQLLDGRLDGCGDKRVQAEARRVAYRLDPAGAVERARHAETERRVSIRPAPDTMTWVTALLPVAHGVAVHASLLRAADIARANADQRTRGQVMADTLVERITGQASADAVPVHVDLVMPYDTVFGSGPGKRDGDERSAPQRATHGGTDEPAQLRGHGPIPAALARDLIRRAPDHAAWIRRIFTNHTGQLHALDSRRRTFTGTLREAILIRDDTSRLPWSDAPIRHIDHVTPHAAGGRTSHTNGAGESESFNHVKQLPGWKVRAGPGGAGQSTIITTPTRHTYESRPPDLPRPGQDRHREEPAA
jgi:hypothetical protein